MAVLLEYVVRGVAGVVGGIGMVVALFGFAELAGRGFWLFAGLFGMVKAFGRFLYWVWLRFGLVVIWILGLFVGYVVWGAARGSALRPAVVFERYKRWEKYGYAQGLQDDYLYCFWVYDVRPVRLDVKFLTLGDQGRMFKTLRNQGAATALFLGSPSDKQQTLYNSRDKQYICYGEGRVYGYKTRARIFNCSYDEYYTQVCTTSRHMGVNMSKFWQDRGVAFNVYQYFVAASSRHSGAGWHSGAGQRRSVGRERGAGRQRGVGRQRGTSSGTGVLFDRHFVWHLMRAGYVWKVRLFEYLSGFLDPDIVGVFMAMLLGQDTYLSADTWQLFASLGLTHILVVSGYNLSLVFSSVGYRAFRAFGKLGGLLVSIFLLILTIIFVGRQPPALRAAAGLFLSQLLLLFGIELHPLALLLLTFLILVILVPFWFVNVGFQLSFLATAGVIIFSRFKFWPQIRFAQIRLAQVRLAWPQFLHFLPRLGRQLRSSLKFPLQSVSRFVPQSILAVARALPQALVRSAKSVLKKISFKLDSIAPVLGATLFTYPLIYYYFGAGFSVYNIFANIVVSAIVDVLTKIGYIALIFLQIPILGKFIAYILAFIYELFLIFLEILKLAKMLLKIP